MIPDVARRRAGLLPAALAALLLLPSGARAQETPGQEPQTGPGGEAEAAPAPEPMVLALADCLKAALENNLDIAVRRYDPLKSEAQVTVQESVFDPLLTGTGLSSEDRRLLTFFSGAPLSTDKTHQYTAGFLDPLTTGGSYRFDVTATDNVNITDFSPTSERSESYETTWKLTYTQPLLRNLGRQANRWQILVARNTLGISEAQFRQTVLNTLSDAEKAYWDLNFAIMDLKTKRGSLQLAQDFLDQNRIKVRVGTLAPIEITQAEAGVADREESVIVAENAVRTAEDNLRRIMNVPRDSPDWGRPIHPADEPPLKEVTPDMAAAVDTAEANRPDLEQARLNLKSRETELSFRRNQRRWGLDFQGTYGALGANGGDPSIGGPFSYGRAVDDLRERNQTNWALGLNLSIPLGNRQAVANFTNAEQGLSQARYDLMRMEQLARVEVRNTVREVETNLKRVKAAKVNTRLQQEKLDAEQKKFENGMSTSFQVLSFQTDLASAETRENQAMVDYNKSLVELERVKGTLLESRQMVLPGGTGAGPAGATAASASLRPLWQRAEERYTSGLEPAAASAGAITLPTSFAWTKDGAAPRRAGTPPAFGTGTEGGDAR